tara:strand:+ start:553 stop:744 length:192 start_codon:yes stop_codon:yes gene_type:complete
MDYLRNHSMIHEGTPRIRRIDTLANCARAVLLVGAFFLLVHIILANHDNGHWSYVWHYYFGGN